MTARGPLTTSIEDSVAVVALDDGKVNAITHETIQAMHEALDLAQAQASAVAIVGRPGALSAGFDLTEMAAGPERALSLVRAGGELLMRIFAHPQPVTVAVTGHALAAGALLVLACDTRVGAAGAHKIGLNETAIGMSLPAYAVELARARLSPAHLTRSALQAEIYDPPGALEAGYLDVVLPEGDCAPEAIARARRLGRFRPGAHSRTKALLRGGVAERALAGLADDLASAMAAQGA